MRQSRVVHTPAYEDMLLEVPTDRILDKAEELERTLETFPDFGIPVYNEYLVSRYGSNLRKLVVDGWIAIYRHDEDVVHMLAIVPGIAVR